MNDDPKKGWFFKNLANQITGIRFVAALWMEFLLILEPKEKIVTAIILTFVAEISDFLDGFAATKLNIHSDFGKIADRVCDRIFVIPTLIIMSCQYIEKVSQHPLLIPLMMALSAFIIIVEIGLMILLAITAKKKLNTGSHHVGRIKMVLQCMAISSWQICFAFEERGGSPLKLQYLTWIVVIFLGIAAYLGKRSLNSHWQEYEKNR